MEIIDRRVEFPNRRRLRKISELGNGEYVVDILRENEQGESYEGRVDDPGTSLNAETLRKIVEYKPVGEISKFARELSGVEQLRHRVLPCNGRRVQNVPPAEGLWNMLRRGRSGVADEFVK